MARPKRVCVNCGKEVKTGEYCNEACRKDYCDRYESIRYGTS